MARFLIGIDDTDNLTTPGTGRRARQLAQVLTEERLATVAGITRHQLLVSPEIPYTSHNSCACLTAEAKAGRSQSLFDRCCRFLRDHSAPGSDAGLCLVLKATAEALKQFGLRAKQEVLTQSDAWDVAAGRDSAVLLAGLTGNRDGVIGALAAVCLRATGEDGRFLWLPGLRELDGVYTARQLAIRGGIDEMRALDGEPARGHDRILACSWVRPVLRGGRAVLLIERTGGDEEFEWRLVARETVKQLS